MASLQVWDGVNNDENAVPGDVKRVLRPRATQAIPRRSALSVINNVLPKTVKNNAEIVKKQNAVPLKPSLIPALNVNKPAGNKFIIFRDTTQLTAESFTDIPSNVTKLYRHKTEPVATRSIPEPITPDEPEDEDSPMVLDSSTDQSMLETTHKEEPYVGTRIYDKDIYKYLRHLETKFRPNPTYMRKQPDVTQDMRCILVDWLVEVAGEYKMNNETLYLAVHFIDRFLSQMSVQKSKLQLVGTACMFIASKIEEIYPPELKDFVYITDDTYTKRQILRMEHLILKVLQFDLTSPTSYYYIEYLCFLSQVSDKVRYLAQYICEISLLASEPFLVYLPSLLAASSLFLAKYTLGIKPWSEQLIEITGYSVDSLASCIKSLHEKHRTIHQCPQQAIAEKYRSSKYDFVSMIKSAELTI